MATMEYLCSMAGVDPGKLSREENLLIEVILICGICDELKEIYQTKIPVNGVKKIIMEDKNMMYGNVINLILQDLIKSNDYTIEGVASYSNVPEDVIYDIAIGSNTNPTLEVARKIIELHKSARVDLYQKVMQKITSQYLISDQESE